jgi:hypothetical protein
MDLTAEIPFAFENYAVCKAIKMSTNIPRTHVWNTPLNNSAHQNRQPTAADFARMLCYLHDGTVSRLSPPL